MEEPSSPDSSSNTTTTTKGVSAAEIEWNNMFNKTVSAISNEMPLLMYGAGDVCPDEVDPGTVQLLSALTAQYICRFVDAAIDSREMLLDHQHIFYPKRKKKRKLNQHNNNNNNNQSTGSDDGGNNNQNSSATASNHHGSHGPTHLYTRMKRPDPPLPPPSFYHSRLPSIPSPPDVDDDDPKNKYGEKNKSGSVGSNKAVGNSKIIIPRYLQQAAKAEEKKNQKLPNVDYWDDPLPEPKIKNKNIPGENGGQYHMTQSEQITAASTADNVHVDEWVGAAGVDLFEHRCRSAYVRGTAAISTHSFIFPICHDVYTYGRIRELQTAKRTVFNSGAILQDNSLMDIIRTEGRNFLRRNKKKKRLSKGKSNKSKSKNEKNSSGNTSDPDDDDDNDDNNDSDSDFSNDGDDPVWPGLEDILPIYRNSLE